MRISAVRKLLGLFVLIGALALIMAPATFADAPVGDDRIFNGRIGAPAAVVSPASAAATTVGLAVAWVAPTGNDTTGDGSQLSPFKTIQKGLDSVAVGGTVYVYPGTYDETAANRFLYDATGPYQFGLFMATNSVTLQGVKADGSPITAYADVATTITTNATNSFGTSGVWVEADDVTIAGLGIAGNVPGDNKTIEVVGNNFTFKNSVVKVPGGGSVYINDWRYDSVNNDSFVEKYTIEGNWLRFGASVDVSSGAGVTGSVADRKIVNNRFTADGENPYWALASFNGIVPSVGWFVYPVGGATITGNDFSGSSQYIRSRGTVFEASFDWVSYWTDNTFDKAVLATTDGNAANPRAFEYTSGTYLMNNVRRIGAAIQPELDNAQAGDTVLVAPGAYNESPTLNKSVTLKSSGGRDVTTINLQTSPNYTGSLLIAGPTVTLDGFTINGFDAVGGGLASTNVYVKSPATTVVVKNNRFKIGQIGSGSTGDDGFGVITEYNTTNAIASLTVADNIFTPLNAEGRRAFYINPAVTQFSFTGNQITGKFSRSAVSEANNSLIENNTVTGVGAEGSRSSGLTVWGYIDPATRGATFRGNTISGVATAISILSANNVIVEQNTISDVGVGVSVEEYGATFDSSGVEIHQNEFNSADNFAVSNATTTTVDAENNWWGSTCPAASLFSGPVDYTPWWTAPDGSTTSTSGVFTIPAGATTAEQNAILSCAPAGSIVTYAGSPAAGGIIVTNNNITIDLGGATVGAGSPAFTILGDDVTLQNGILNGDGDDPGVLVADGADNFTLNAMEIESWLDGVVVTGSHASLKIVNNWFHDNDNGLQFNGDAALSGVITIEGNLFKSNTGPGIQNESAASVEAEYNSWGNVAGPGAGDGISTNVDADPWSFVEVFTDADALSVVENQVFTVNVKVEAAGLYAVQYKLTFDPKLLVLQGVSDGPFKGTGSCATDTATAGTISVYCTRFSPDADVNAATEIVSVLTFKADPNASHDGEDTWTATLDLSSAPADLYAGARDGIKVWVNNGGFGLPSVTARDITDTTDGTISIAGLAQFKGYIDLQGRTNDSGALLSVYDAASTTTSVLKATATSAASGAYVTAYVSGQQLSVGNTYYFQVDRDLYLPTTRTVATDVPAPTDWADFKLLSDRPDTVLGTVVLLGGDATNDNAVDVLDAGAIGGAYGTVVPCGAGACTDVTGDGKVDILDLTLMGGNYNKTSSPWVE